MSSEVGSKDPNYCQSAKEEYFPTSLSYVFPKHVGVLLIYAHTVCSLLDVDIHVRMSLLHRCIPNPAQPAHVQTPGRRARESEANSLP